MTTVPVETSHPDPVPLESTGASSEKQTDLGLEKLSLSKGPESASNDANTDLDMSIIGEGEMTPCFSDEASDLAAGAGDPVSGPPSTEAAAKDDDGLASGEGAQDPRDGKTADKSDSKLGRLTNWSAKKLDELASASKGAITTAMIRLIKE